MIIGIDVGGTHADGVLLDGSSLVKKNKINVHEFKLEDAIVTLLQSLLPKDKNKLERIHLSTTLCTNAIVNDKMADVGMFIQAGPGINPDFLSCGKHVIQLDGTIDHRGQPISTPTLDEIENQINTMSKDTISSVGIVTKFSQRNNSHELLIQKAIHSSFDHISLGHRLSGMPNFPRRVYTTWLNSGLMPLFAQFKSSMEKSFSDLDINCPCYILKADGGTIPFINACESPCQSIHSGPSASVMGALALHKDITNTILLDIGGTTTDISLFANGVPLLEPYGATVAGRPTLIRALQTKSIGLGGDSCVRFIDGSYSIGPQKLGPPMAFGGTTPTPTDAMITLGTLEAGSITLARKAMELLRPDLPPAETADHIIDFFVEKIKSAAHDMIEEIFLRPVYTISALLGKEKIKPENLIAIGGPALALQPRLEEVFALDCFIPADYEVANAIGAARAKLTVQASLYADSSTGRLSIPETSCMESISKSYTMLTAETRLTQELARLGEQMGVRTEPDIEIIEKQELNTVRGFATTGKIISIKAQIKPGLSSTEEKI